MAPDKGNKGEYGQKRALDRADLKVDLTLDQQKMEGLKEIRESLVEVRKVRRKNAIERGKRKAKEKFEENIPESFAAAKSTKEKQVFLKEILRGELEYSNDEIHAITYGEQKTYGFNVERFNGKEGKNGWLSQYEEYYESNKRSSDVKGLEEFVLEKQFEELEKTRNSLMEARTEAFLVKMQPELGEKGKNSELEVKKNDLLEDVDGFMKVNAQKIEKWVETGDFEQFQSLSEKFKFSLFRTENSPEKIEIIEGYFNDLMQDYRQMIVEKSTLEKLNPKMVQMMVEGVNEEEWNKRLMEEAAKKVQQMEEEKMAEEALKQPIYDEDVRVGEVAANIGYDLIPMGSQVTFEKIGAGKYKITYPGKKYQTFFEVRQIKTEDGKNSKLQFVFEDGYLDGGKKVTDAAGFAEQVNALHLDQIMNRDFKRGRDYQGVELNDVFDDKSMLKVAKMLFYPKSLGEMPLGNDDVRVFKNLVRVITNSENNARGQGLYGDLRVLGHRINLLETVLVKPEIAGKFKNALNGKNNLLNKEIDGLNLERFLSEYIGVESNYGNFEKG
jgi:hypothetical protein